MANQLACPMGFKPTDPERLLMWERRIEILKSRGVELGILDTPKVNIIPYQRAKLRAVLGLKAQ